MRRQKFLRRVERSGRVWLTSVLLSVLSTLPTACSESALPPAASIVSDVAIASPVVDGQTLYWAASTGSETNTTGRVMRIRLDRPGSLETLAHDQINPNSLVVGGGAVYWQNEHGGAISCGSSLMSWDAQSGVRERRPIEHCKVLPLAVDNSSLVVLTSDESSQAIARMDLATSEWVATTPLPGAFHGFSVGVRAIFLRVEIDSKYTLWRLDRTTLAWSQVPTGDVGAGESLGSAMAAGDLVVWTINGPMNTSRQLIWDELSTPRPVTREPTTSLYAISATLDAGWFVGFPVNDSDELPYFLGRLDFGTRKLDVVEVPYPIGEFVAGQGGLFFVRRARYSSQGEILFQPWRQ